MNGRTKIICYILPALIMTGVMTSGHAQTVSIPDSGLNAAIRDALQKPSGLLTEQDLLSLTKLEASFRNVRNINGLEGARNLVSLDLGFNALTNVSLPTNMTALARLDLEGNLLTHFALPAGLKNLSSLNLSDNQLNSLTLPADMQQLTELFLDGNPLATLVLSEPLAATNLADTVATLRGQNISVFTFPLTLQVIAPRPVGGAFTLAVTGPPDVYTVQGSVDLAVWTGLGTVTNGTGTARFIDLTAHLSARKFYRAGP